MQIPSSRTARVALVLAVGAWQIETQREIPALEIAACQFAAARIEGVDVAQLA